MKSIRRIVLLLVMSLSALSINGCVSPIIDGTVEAEWVSKGAPVPFDGLLMSEGTYYRLRQKIIRLENQ